MKKNQQTSYDIFVKKLSQKMGKILLREDLYHLWCLAGGSKSRFTYGLGKAKNQGHIIILGGGIFSVREGRTPLTEGSFAGEDTHGSQIEHSLEEHYWTVLSFLIREHAPSGAIIAHEKSLELHLKNYEIPECIVLYTRDRAKRIRIGPYEFHFRTLQSGEKSSGKNMYRILLEHSVEIILESMTFHTLSIEASILDVASLKIHDSGIEESLIIRFIKKYEKSFSREDLGKLVSYRYIRAINRIRSIAKEHGFTRLYEMTLDIIKKEGGGCYIKS